MGALSAAEADVVYRLRAVHGLPGDTPFYAESFQMLAQNGGTLPPKARPCSTPFICSVLILGLASAPDETPTFREANFGLLIRKSVVVLCALLLATATIYTTAIRAIYGNQSTGWGGDNLRFGPNADWRVKPLLKSKRHN